MHSRSALTGGSALRPLLKTENGYDQARERCPSADNERVLVDGEAWLSDAEGRMAVMRSSRRHSKLCEKQPYALNIAAAEGLME